MGPCALLIDLMTKIKYLMSGGDEHGDRHGRKEKKEKEKVEKGPVTITDSYFPCFLGRQLRSYL